MELDEISGTGGDHDIPQEMAAQRIKLFFFIYRALLSILTLRVNVPFNSLCKHFLISVSNSNKRAIIRRSKLVFKVFSNILKQSIILRFISKYIN